MNAQQPKDPPQCTVEFLLTEHKYLSESFWRNEESGEKRFNFFIALITAVSGALVALYTSPFKPDIHLFRMITIFTLLALLSFGFITLLRMIHRNKVTDEYKKAIDEIRGHFREWDTERLQNYYPFGKGKLTTDRDNKKSYIIRKQRGNVFSRLAKVRTGGFVYMVALINSFLVAGTFFMALVFSHLEWIIVLLLSLVFSSAMLLQLMLIPERDGK